MGKKKKELKTFEVTVTVDYLVTVEAEDEEQATDLAYDFWSSEDYIDTVDVNYVKEV